MIKSQEKLNSASNWGIFDMFGGGLFSAIMKHSKMDDAQQLMEAAKTDFYLKDACQGDSPRREQGDSHRGATSVGIIGLRPKAVDGEVYYHPDGTVAKLRVCCSSMYFEKPEKIEWKLTFKEKRVSDI